MRMIRVPQNSFQFGEVSPETLMRTDSQIYTASGQNLQNMMLLAEGGVLKRPGMKFEVDTGITGAAGGRLKHMLVPFIYDDNEEYLISIENGEVNCYRVTDTAVTAVQTITQDTDTDALPFDEDYIQEYTYAQYGDIMVICHPLFLPRLLVRTSLTSFEIQKFSFDVRADNSQIYQPYSKFHPTGVTLSASATTGTGVTLTTSANYWDAAHVGTYVRYGETEIQITAVTNATTATGSIVGTLRRRLAVIDPLRTFDGSTTVEVTHINHGFSGGESITIEEAGAVGGISAANINGSRTVGTVLDANTYTITAGAAATSSIDGGGLVKIVTGAATDDWTEQSFSALRGYPAAVTFHENRLVFGGTIAEPDTLWMSKSSQFYNFDYGDAEDNDAINLVTSTGSVSNIRYLVSSRDLQVFTDTSEFYVPAYLNQVLTPTNAQVRRQTPYGTEFCTPTPLDGATLFVQSGGKVVREFLYTDDENAYASTAVSVIASHLIKQPKDVAVVHSAFDLSESYAVFVNTDGSVAVFSSNRVESRAGWTPWVIMDGAESVAAIGTKLFFSVWGNGKLYIGQLNTDVPVDNAINPTIDYVTAENLITASNAPAGTDIVDPVSCSVTGGQYPNGGYPTNWDRGSNNANYPFIWCIDPGNTLFFSGDHSGGAFIYGSNSSFNNVWYPAAYEMNTTPGQTYIVSFRYKVGAGSRCLFSIMLTDPELSSANDVIVESPAGDAVYSTWASYDQPGLTFPQAATFSYHPWYTRCLGTEGTWAASFTATGTKSWLVFSSYNFVLTTNPDFDINDIFTYGLFITDLSVVDFGGYMANTTNADITAVNTVSDPDGGTAASTVSDNGAVDGTGAFDTVTIGTGIVVPFGDLDAAGEVEYTVSAYFKQANADYDFVYFNFANMGSVNGNVWFNIETGATGTNSNATELTPAISSEGDGWYRLSVTFTTDASQTNGNINFFSSEADNTTTSETAVEERYHIYGVQLERGSSPGTYQATTTQTTDDLPGSIVGATATVTSGPYTTNDVVSVVGVASDGTQTPLGNLTVIDDGGTAKVNVLEFAAEAYDSVYVGEFYTPIIKTNPVDVAVGYGPVTGDVRGLKAVVVDFLNSGPCTVNGWNFIPVPSGYSGKKKFWMSGYGEDVYVTITQTLPYRLQVNGIVSELLI